MFSVADLSVCEETAKDQALQMTEKVLRRQALASAPASAPGRPPAASSKFCLHFILSERHWSSSASIYIKTAAFATSQAGNFLFIV